MDVVHRLALFGLRDGDRKLTCRLSLAGAGDGPFNAALLEVYDDIEDAEPLATVKVTLKGNVLRLAAHPHQDTEGVGRSTAMAVLSDVEEAIKLASGGSGGLGE